MDKKTLRAFRGQLRRVERSFSGFLDEDARCCGLGVAQCHVLLAIEERSETTITSLAAEFELDKSTLSRTIDPMVNSGLVTRTTNPQNRRSQILGLTVKGEKTAAEINGTWDQYIRAIFARIAEAKHPIVLSGFRLFLEAVAANRGCCLPEKSKKGKAKN